MSPQRLDHLGHVLGGTRYSCFNLAVEYLPDESNVVADALSRWVYPSDEGQSDVSKHGSAAEAEFLRQSAASVSPVTSSSSSDQFRFGKRLLLHLNAHQRFHTRPHRSRSKAETQYFDAQH